MTSEAETGVIVGRPAELPAVGPDTVSVWWVDLDAAAPPDDVLEGMLDRHEAERARRFRNVIHRRQYMLSHAALRLILGALLKCRPQDISFYRHEGGKPAIQLPPGLPMLDFSLSHSDGAAMIGVSCGGMIGVDVERHAPRDCLDIARCWFTQAEANWLARLSEPERSRRFLECWTCKEAYLKAIGLGLSGGLQSCHCELSPEGAIVARVTQRHGIFDGRWRFIPMEWRNARCCIAIGNSSVDVDIDVQDFDWSRVR